MSGSFTRRAKALTFGGLATLGLAVVAQLAVTPSATSVETTTLPLHQDLPITNSGFSEHDTESCPESPAQWGWHFVVTGGEGTFVALSTTFANAGTIVTTTFGPPDAKHAYVYTATDDTLTAVVATVAGADDKTKVVLSHTCSGGGTEETPTPTPSETVSETPSATPSETVSETPSATPSETVSETPSATPSETVSETPSETVSPTETVSETPSETPTAEVSATETETATPSPTESAEVLPTVITNTPTPSASVKGVKVVRPVVAPTRLPSTGTPFPVMALVLLGVGLLAAGVVTTVAGEPRAAGTKPRHRA